MDDQHVRELQQLKRENAKLKLEKDRLARQLQVEKEENLRSYGFTSAKGREDQDDDEIPVPPVVKKESVCTERLQSSHQHASPSKPGAVPQRKAASKRRLQTARRSDTPVEPMIPSTPRSTKRRRSDEDDLQAELEFLLRSDFLKTIPPRRKKVANGARPTNSKEEAVDFGFEFEAITEWHEAENPEELSVSLFSSDEIKACGELVDRILQTTEIWENNIGGDWKYDFEKSDCKAPMCVPAKTAGSKTKWRRGDKSGQYSCRECMVYGRPCFRYTTGQGFELLPLHPDDRTGRVVRGRTELCYWINDDTKFSAADMWVGGEADEDYVEDE